MKNRVVLSRRIELIPLVHLFCCLLESIGLSDPKIVPAIEAMSYRYDISTGFWHPMQFSRSVGAARQWGCCARRRQVPRVVQRRVLRVSPACGPPEGGESVGATRFPLVLLIGAFERRSDLSHSVWLCQAGGTRSDPAGEANAVLRASVPAEANSNHSRHGMPTRGACSGKVEHVCTEQNAHREGFVADCGECVRQTNYSDEGGDKPPL